MIQQLILLHRPGGGAELNAPHWLAIQTCLRSLCVGLESWEKPQGTGPEWEEYRGPRAYSELLEVACGLKSPVLGETEVFGQIRKACNNFRHPDPRSHGDFQKIIEKMYADVKTVRTLHLKGTGSRSYGSYARKFFKGESALRVLGTGLLAKEILPWLIKSIEQVVVHSRQPDLKKSLEAQWKVSVQGFTEISGPQECGLLVASPMKSEEILSWMENQNLRITKILDLREESAQDPLAVESTGQVCENLQDVFAAFEKNKASMEHIRAQALAEIQKCVQARFQGVESSAKGWDECAG